MWALPSPTCFALSLQESGAIELAPFNIHQFNEGIIFHKLSSYILPVLCQAKMKTCANKKYPQIARNLINPSNQ